MQVICLDDTPFAGRSRSYSLLAGLQVHANITCTRCGSSLAARFERTRRATIGRASYEVDVYRCGCGRGREIRRSA